MTKRIFRSIFLVALCVLLASLMLIMSVLYSYFNQTQQTQLKTQTELIAHSIELLGDDYFEGLHPGGYRITWIAPDGAVRRDTSANAASMENHLDREEIQEAIQSGYGEGSRMSSTLTTKMLYAARMLPDGSIIRVATSQYSLLSFTVLMQQPIALLLIVLAVISGLLASSLSRKIVQPLNALNLDDPLSNDTYEEVSPLLTRIAHQHLQIDDQMGALRRKQEELEVITIGMSEGLVLLNAEGSILSLNPAAARLLGVSTNAAGRDMLTVNRSLAMQELLEQACAGSRAQTVLELAGGEYQIAASPVISGGSVTGIVLLMFDITEKTRAERLRREFTANVSHELKTPLHSISGCAEILKNGLVKEGDKQQFLEQIYGEAQRLITLVDDIIRLSRLDEGAEGLPRERVDLYACARETLSRLESYAKDQQVDLRLEGGPADICGIERLLGEILYNLCDNAIKYNRPGGNVTVTVSDSVQEAVLAVRDTGIGIPAEHHNRVFERFYRVDKSHSKEIGGTGLGLSIVKHAALIHGAAMFLDSTPGVGTTVTIRFPK